MEGAKKINKNSCIVALGAIIVLLLHVHGMARINYPYIIDEIGYWGVAASINGFDWSGIMTNVPYYSYGYSFIIAALLAVFKNAVLVYKLQIIINGIFMMCSFLIAYNMGSKLFEKLDTKYLVLTSMAVTVYSSHLTLSNTGLTESLLVLLCWVNVWLVYKYVNSNKTKYLISTVLISVYAYIVHQRMLAMIVASAITILFKIFEDKKKNWKKIGMIIGIAATVLILIVLLKNVFIDKVWVNTDEAYRNINDYGVMFNKIKGLLDVRTLAETIEEMLGLIFYIGVATFGVAYIGVFATIKKTVDYFKGSRKNLFYTYVLLLFICLLGISTIYYSSGIDRADQAIYGRYIEVSYGILLLLGFHQIYNFTKKNIYFGLIIPYWLGMGCILDRRIARYGVGDYYSEGSAVALAWFYKEMDLSMKKIALLISIFFAIIVLILMLEKKVCSYVVLTGIMVWFVVTGLHVRTSYVYEREADYQENYSIIGMTEDINGQLPVYCLDYEDDKSKTWMNYIQFQLFDKKVEVATTEEILADNTEKFVITSTKNNLMRTLGLGDNYDMIAMGEKYTLYISKGSTNDKYTSEGNVYMDVNGEVILPLELFTVSNGKYDEKENVIISNGKEGRFIRGFKQNVHQGQYKYKYEMGLLEHNTEDIGKFVVYINSEKYEEIPFTAAEFNDETLIKEILCDIPQECVLEVILELNEGSVVEVRSVKVE